MFFSINLLGFSILKYMNKKTVFVDMDGILNRFWEPYVQYYNQIYQDKKKLGANDLVDYSVARCLGLTDTMADRLDLSIMSKQEFWLNIPVYNGAIEVMERLCERFDVYVLSTPWSGYKDCIRDKMMWMESKFPFFNTKNMIFTHHKSLLRGDVIVDDHPKNLQLFQGKTVTITYPYNKDVKVDFRSTSWHDIGKWIEGNVL